MRRRDFMQKGALSGSFLAFGGLQSFAGAHLDLSQPENTFKLNYAPHIGMFEKSAGKDPIDQLMFMADQGFTAFEDNEMRNRPVELQEKMAQTMQKRGIEMGVFVAHTIYWTTPNLTSGNKALREEFLSEIKSSIEVAKRVNAKWVTVVPGFVDQTQNKEYQSAHVIESLKQASALLEPHGITMVLEPLNFYNHPGMFLSESPQAYHICKAVGSPSCKILYDIYHQQIQEGNLIPNIENSWDEIAYFQVGDNPGRKEPGTGEINFQNVFKFIHEKGYKGMVGMEHGNSIEGEKGEKAVIEAYLKADTY
ncbi:hydroxypyruvate isomerase family protein [Flavimarina sp. Hel_I_48]|uniref:hydroxypyruvate isomerase family protein n=1 Tax=Flavimarina sp. Hel_I_48 TaxID=1392488 RepID=UPI0004DF7F8C|nr:TIM barrel protein [Flavimarina sp. Hel_I_48]